MNRGMKDEGVGPGAGVGVGIEVGSYFLLSYCYIAYCLVSISIRLVVSRLGMLDVRYY